MPITCGEKFRYDNFLLTNKQTVIFFHYDITNGKLSFYNNCHFIQIEFHQYICKAIEKEFSQTVAEENDFTLACCKCKIFITFYQNLVHLHTNY